MKTLHFLRHAKSSWDDPNQPDHERVLNKRGKRDAPRIGSALSQRLAPLSIQVSSANRAQLTLKGLCKGWPELKKMQHITHDELYTFNSDELFNWITAQGDDKDALFVIAHNPALTDLVNTLVGRHCLDNLPTAGYAQLTAKIDRWRDLHQGCAVLEYSLFPRQLGDA